MRKAKNILLTGGHGGTTAIATVQALLSLKPKKDLKIFWIGAKYAYEGAKVPPLEFSVLSEMGVSCLSVFSGRVQRKWTKYTLFSLCKIPIGFVHALFLVGKIRPSVTVTFGGFAAFPVVFASFLKRVPIIVHEQTSAAGLANRLSTRFADIIVLAREESRKYFPRHKSIVLGNPLLAGVAKLKPKAKISQPPTIFVTCGSRGSQPINQVIERVLIKLLASFKVVHQTGEASFRYFVDLRAKLKYAQRKNYQVIARIDPRKVDYYFARADLIIARGGANTVSEIMACRIPAIIIPIPWVQKQEQLENARLAERMGLAQILPQDKLTPKNLLEKIGLVFSDWEKIISSAKTDLSDLDRKASRKLAQRILSYLD